MRRLLALILLASCAPAARLAVAPPAADDITLFRDVRVFDGERVHERTNIVVRAGVIAGMGPRAAVPAGAHVVDGAGLTLLPGLIDAHVHTFGDALREAAIFGVTTVLDMFTDPAQVRRWRAEQAAGAATDRADIFSAGYLITAPGGHGTQFGPIPTITDVDSAQAFVDARIAEGSDWIKIIHEDGSAFGMARPTVSEELVRALIAAAHARNRRAVVHVSTVRAAEQAIAAGADGLVHMFIDSIARPGFPERVHARNAFVVPTLVVLRGITGTGGAAPLADDPRIAPYLPATSRALLTQAYPPQPGATERYENARRSVAMLSRAGVPILAGSDAPNPGTAHGVALHRELELLVEAGLTPAEALAAATAAAADAFGLTDRGRIAVGRRADLLLVEGDPTRDITATRAITGVWKGGVRIDRDAWRTAVAGAEARAERARAGGIISDFEDGTAATSFGTDWLQSTDAFAGGTSTAAFDVVSGGAGGSAHSLRISGEISGGLPQAWAGIMWSPGAQPMAPADLSGRTGFAFETRGDGRTYRVIVFAAARGMNPVMTDFVAGSDWSTVRVPWSQLGLDGRDIMALVISASLPAGAFTVQVDNVRIY